MERFMKKIFCRETILYFIFGVLTTLTDWGVYAWLRYCGVDYRISTIGSWVAAVLFAFVTNKLLVFQSLEMTKRLLWKEFSSFVTCRAATGLLSLGIMILMVDGLHISQDFFCKVVVSAISLVLNYALSKIFIFKNAS